MSKEKLKVFLLEDEIMPSREKIEGDEEKSLYPEKYRGNIIVHKPKGSKNFSVVYVYPDGESYMVLFSLFMPVVPDHEKERQDAMSHYINEVREGIAEVMLNADLWKSCYSDHIKREHHDEIKENVRAEIMREMSLN